MMKIALVGGGSGGHITPLLAVARELKALQPNVELIYIGERGGKFAHVAETAGLFADVYLISAGKFRRYPGSKLKKLLDVPTNARNARDAVRLARGTVQARRLLKRVQPDGIFIKGGFVGVPVGKAAAALKIPYVTHDSDAIPGLANRLIAKHAAVHATGMPTEAYTYPKDKTVFVGIPVAPEFEALNPANRTRYRNELGLDHFTHVLTVVGGSQGAVRINKLVSSILPELLADNPKLGVIHIVGAANTEAMEREYLRSLLPEHRQQVRVEGFVADMFRYSGAADLVITRAGATNMAEFAVQRQACIIIPSGALANDHQSKNAEVFKAQEAGVVLNERELEAKPNLLKGAITDLLGDPSRRALLGRNLARLCKTDAAHELAELLLKTFQKGKS